MVFIQCAVAYALQALHKYVRANHTSEWELQKKGNQIKNDNNLDMGPFCEIVLSYFFSAFSFQQRLRYTYTLNIFNEKQHFSFYSHQIIVKYHILNEKWKLIFSHQRKTYR